MASSKTKRVAAVTALSASLLIGGIAAAQADGPICRHGQGKGLGIGAPGNGKGKGAERGWPHGCKDNDKNHSDQDGDTPEAGSENPVVASASETPDATVQSSSTTDAGDMVSVDASVEVALPDAGDLAAQTAQDVKGVVSILRPIAETVIGQARQAADEAQQAAGQTVDLAKSDVAGIVGLLEAARAEAASVPGPSFDAGITVDGTNAGAAVDISGGTLSGITTLAAHLATGALNLVAGMTPAL